MTRTTLVLILMMVSGALVRADLTPIGYISIDAGVPIGGIDTIGVGNLTGETYGCSVPSGFQVCTDLTLSGTVTFQFQDGSNVDTEIVPLAESLGPGLYDPVEFQYLDAATLLSATFTGTIDTTNLEMVRPDGSLGEFTASPDIVSTALTPDQPLALLQVNTNPVAMPEGPDFTFLEMGIGLVGFQMRHRFRAAGRRIFWRRSA